MARCYICDKVLQPYEIEIVDDKTEPCSKCMTTIRDTIQEDTALYESQTEDFEQYAME